MKIHVLSDLHNEFKVFQPPATDADVVVLAGDIGVGPKGVAWAKKSFPDKRVVYIPGNHEFYRNHIGKMLQAMRAEAALSQVHVLDNDEVVIDGVRFLGTTLWTDFALFGTTSIATALKTVGANLQDFNYNILYGEGRVPGYFTPEQSKALHEISVCWLRDKLKEPFKGPTVVVTHHAPAKESIAARYSSDILSAAFASDLSHLLGPADLWIHGHVHDSFDYVLSSTRVICNPRGYPQYVGNQENQNFSPNLVVKL